MGTDNIKKVLALAFKIGKQTETDIDTKQNFLGFVSSYSDELWEVISLYQSFGAIKDEFNELDSDEIIELGTWAAKEFDLDNDKIEGVIDDFLVWIASTIGLVLNLRNAFKK